MTLECIFRDVHVFDTNFSTMHARATVLYKIDCLGFGMSAFNACPFLNRFPFGPDASHNWGNFSHNSAPNTHKYFLLELIWISASVLSGDFSHTSGSEIPALITNCCEFGRTIRLLLESRFDFCLGLHDLVSSQWLSSLSSWSLQGTPSSIQYPAKGGVEGS